MSIKRLAKNSRERKMKCILCPCIYSENDVLASVLLQFDLYTLDVVKQT